MRPYRAPQPIAGEISGLARSTPGSWIFSFFTEFIRPAPTCDGAVCFRAACDGPMRFRAAITATGACVLSAIRHSDARPLRPAIDALRKRIFSEYTIDR